MQVTADLGHFAILLCDIAHSLICEAFKEHFVVTCFIHVSLYYNIITISCVYIDIWSITNRMHITHEQTI